MIYICAVWYKDLFTSAPDDISSFTLDTWPLRQASWSGLIRSKFGVLTSYPSSIKYLITSSQPPAAALWRGNSAVTTKVKKHNNVKKSLKNSRDENNYMYMYLTFFFCKNNIYSIAMIIGEAILHTFLRKVKLCA